MDEFQKKCLDYLINLLKDTDIFMIKSVLNKPSDRFMKQALLSTYLIDRNKDDIDKNITSLKIKDPIDEFDIDPIGYDIIMQDISDNEPKSCKISLKSISTGEIFQRNNKKTKGKNVKLTSPGKIQFLNVRSDKSPNLEAGQNFKKLKKSIENFDILVVIQYPFKKDNSHTPFMIGAISKTDVANNISEQLETSNIKYNFNDQITLSIPNKCYSLIKEFEYDKSTLDLLDNEKFKQYENKLFREQSRNYYRGFIKNRQKTIEYLSKDLQNEAG